MSRILHGSFDVVSFSKLNSEPGHRWVYNGIFLESVPHEGGAQAGSPSPSPSPGPGHKPQPQPLTVGSTRWQSARPITPASGGASGKRALC